MKKPPATIPIDYTKNPIPKNGPDNSAAYKKLRQEHAILNSKEAAKVTGQGCADIYPGGFPA